MIAIRFPNQPFKILQQGDKEIIFDSIRKAWVVLTPEEWVRQNFIQYLAIEKKYPLSLIAIEREIKLVDVKKRFDIVVYRATKPWMLVECKEMNVPLTEKVVAQILNYNIALNVHYLVISNGRQTYAAHLNQGNYAWLNELPAY